MDNGYKMDYGLWAMDYGYGQWASGRTMKMLCPFRAVVIVVVVFRFFLFFFGLLFSFFSI